MSRSPLKHRHSLRTLVPATLRRRAALLAIAADGCALVRADRSNAAQRITMLGQLGADDNGFARISTWLDDMIENHALAHSRIDLLLADDLVHLFTVEPPAGLRSVTEVAALAEQRFEVITGERGDKWIVCCDWRASDPTLVLAAPRALIETVQAATRVHGIHLGSCQAYACAQFNAIAKGLEKNTVVCAYTEHTATVFLTQEQRVQSLRTIRWSERERLASEVSGWVSRESMRLNFSSPPQRVHCAGFGGSLGSMREQAGLQWYGPQSAPISINSMQDVSSQISTPSKDRAPSRAEQLAAAGFAL